MRYLTPARWLSGTPLRHLVSIGLSFSAFAFGPTTAKAQDIFYTSEKVFFDPEDRFKRVGIESEMGGLTFDQIEAIVRKHYEVLEVTKPSELETNLRIREGIIKLKIEGQAWRYEGDDAKYAAQLAEDIKVAPREIVFPPLIYQRAIPLQALSDDLEAAGAIGTRPDLAVAFQVNYEIGSLIEDPRRVTTVVDLLKTYYDPSNMKQIDDALKVPASRREFLGDLTPGFRKKLYSPGYDPNPRELFEDYLYRQSAENFGYKGAWTGTIPEIWAFLSRLKDPVDQKVVKMQRVRISSLLLEAFPEDPLSKLILDSHWAVAAPIAEFREMNMIFSKVDHYIRSILGMVQAVKKYGYFKHDELMSKLTGIPVSDFPRIRRKVEEGKPFIIRYLLEDPKTNPMTVADREVPGSKALWTQLSADARGIYPLQVGGESIVFNRRHIHRTTLVGEYNPGLDHGYIQQAVENKLTEAKLFGYYAPGSMPEFAALRDMVDTKKISPKAAFKAASKRFPKGWVMKGSWDLGSEKSFISDKIDIDRAIKDYEKGYEKYRAKVLEKYEGHDPEMIAKELKAHPGYQGWKILSMLEHPDQVFFQALLPIDREFRVEVLNGKVIRGATIDRYAYMEKKAVPPTAAELTEVEDYTQHLLDQLPFELKVLPYGFDVARLKKGTGFAVIETNPGGNSSFLEESVPSVKAFEAALMEYRLEAKAGTLERLTPRKEMAWLKTQFAKFKISPSKDYPGMTFVDTGINDPEYGMIEACPELFNPHRIVPWSE